LRHEKAEWQRKGVFGDEREKREGRFYYYTTPLEQRKDYCI
jgi:hypothetical protein